MTILNESRVKISNTAVIHPDCSIGELGFGYNKEEDGSYTRQVHEFGVVIEDYVEISSKVSIHLGRWRDTIIKKGTIIDSGAHIAHNCVIGENCIIGAGACLGGSVTVGEGSDIWMNATIHQGVTIGKNSAVGAGTYLRKDVPDNSVAYNPGNGTIIKPKEDTGKYGKHNLV